jgi:hypothetical protein
MNKDTKCGPENHAMHLFIYQLTTSESMVAGPERATVSFRANSLGEKSEGGF